MDKPWVETKLRDGKKNGKKTEKNGKKTEKKQKKITKNNKTTKQALTNITLRGVMIVTPAPSPPKKKHIYIYIYEHCNYLPGLAAKTRNCVRPLATLLPLGIRTLIGDAGLIPPLSEAGDY